MSNQKKALTKHKNTKKTIPAYTLFGWIVALINLAALAGFWVLFSAADNFPSTPYLTLSALIFGTCIINLIFVFVRNQVKPLPKPKYILFFGSISIALAKIASLPILQFAVSNLISPQSLNTPIYYTSLITATILIFALIDAVFFAILKKLTFTFNAKTYLSTTITFALIYLIPLIYGVIIAPYITIDSPVAFTIRFLLTFLAIGIITAIIGKLSQPKQKPAKTKK